MRILALAFYNTHRSQIDDAIAPSPTPINSGRHGEDGSAIADSLILHLTLSDCLSHNFAESGKKAIALRRSFTYLGNIQQF